jgi:hypothetical protein
MVRASWSIDIDHYEINLKDVVAPPPIPDFTETL